MSSRSKVIPATFVFWAILGIAFTLAQREVKGAQPTSPWPQFGGDARGSRISDFFGPTVQPTLKWFFPTDSSGSFPLRPLVYASPTIGVDGTIYAPAYDGYIHAIHEDGSLKWKHWIGENLRASATVAEDGSVYHLSNIGLLHLDQSENVLFQTDALQNNQPSITLDSTGRLYVGSGSEMSLRQADGAKIWSIDVGGLIEGTPVVDEDGTAYFGSQSGPGYLNAVDDEGQLLWTFTIPGRNVASATIGDDGTIYAGGQSGDFFAINPDGTEKWRFSDADDIYTAAALVNNSIVFAARDGIYALDLDGNELWRYNDTSSGHGSVITDANGNIFATRNNRVLGLASSGDLIWEYALDASNYIYSSVTLDHRGVLYFGAKDGLYAISVPVPEPSEAATLLTMLVSIIWLPWRRILLHK